MADITFSEERDGTWVVARWAFRQVLEDVKREYAGDSEMEAELTTADAVGYLHVDSLHGPLAARLTAAFRDVVSGILSKTVLSSISENYSDEETTAQYREGLKLLLAAIPPANGLS